MDTQHLGRKGEELAKKYFDKQGYQCLEMNYRCRFGEIDLILKKESVIVFCEVKLRTNNNFGSGEESIHQGKIRKILKTVYWYLKNQPEASWRLDAVVIDYDKWQNKAKLRHYKNILE